MNYVTPRLSLPGIQPPPRDPKQTKARLGSGPQNLCSPVSICGCLEFLRLRPCFLALSALLFAFLCLPLTQAADFYVATDGSDSNPGTIDQPFATLNGARTAIRALSHPLSSSVTVWIRGGRYYLQSAFALSGSQDSGTPTAPVVYKNYPNETPYVIGGVVVTNFQAVTDPTILARLTMSAQANVLVADLTAQAITNLGMMTNHGYCHHDGDQAEKPFQSELLFQDHSMQLARYPNGTNWLKLAAPTTTNSFAYIGTNPTTWADLSDVWAHGYWNYDYSDSLERVISINTTNKIVTLQYPAAMYNAYRAGQRFYFFNVLEELDSSGEYYIDRTYGKIYFWPPNTITNGACIVSTATNLVTLTSVSNVAFSGITFEAGKSILVLVSQGQSNLVTSCFLRGGSADGVKIIASPGSCVSHCAITDMGERAVWIYGSGTRNNLVSGNNSIAYNTISNVSRLCRGNKNAIEASHTYYLVSENVVGVYIGYNLIHDLPHQAIALYGNNHLVEHNEIYRVCTETADAGAIYSGFDWTFRGTTIRYNYLHDINIGGGATDYTGVIGIYADAAWSGVAIYGNIFCAVDHGVFINGGRDNTIQNNIFVNCSNPPVSMPAYSILVGQWAAKSGYATETNSVLWARLRVMPYQTPPWSDQYPALVTIATNHPGLALSNVISGNISYRNSTWISWADNANTNATVMNNFTNGDPLFVDYANRNFGLLTNSPVWDLGFQSLPTIGFSPQLLPASGLYNLRPR